MNYRLKQYLSELNIYDGETPRGASAIKLALSGANTQEAMDHIGWSTNKSFKRYSRISKMMSKGSVSSLMKSVAQNYGCDVESVFESLNATQEF